MPASGHYLPMVVLVGVVACAVGLGQAIALTDGIARRNLPIAIHVAASGVGTMLGAVAALWVGTYIIDADFTSVTSVPLATVTSRRGRRSPIRTAPPRRARPGARHR